jgi:uncharacterized protein (DUF1697 family)
MKELVELCLELGFKEVETYLQSGNILLNSDLPQEQIEALVQQGISETLGHPDVDVLAWTAESLGAIISGLPEAWSSYAPSTLHFTFLKQAPVKEMTVDSASFLPDEFAFGDGVVYVHCPQGYGRTKLNNSFFERAAGVRATTRNWNSVNKLYELALTARAGDKA